MKVLEAREREFKRVRRDEVEVRHTNQAQRWDGVSGVYTVRSRASTDPGVHPEVTKDDVVGVACEPIS